MDPVVIECLSGSLPKPSAKAFIPLRMWSPSSCRLQKRIKPIVTVLATDSANISIFKFLGIQTRPRSASSGLCCCGQQLLRIHACCDSRHAHRPIPLHCSDIAEGLLLKLIPSRRRRKCARKMSPLLSCSPASRLHCAFRSQCSMS